MAVGISSMRLLLNNQLLGHEYLSIESLVPQPSGSTTMSFSL